jgi:hypothetical protein
MQPKALRNHAMVRGSDGLLRLELVDSARECVLDPLAELIWDLCDGSRDVEALAQAAGRAFDRVVHKEEVFSALDFLVDACLIEERVAPPVAEGNVSRRSLVSWIAPVVGAAASMMWEASARGQYNESDSKESSNKAAHREADSKESSNKEFHRKADSKESSDKEFHGEGDSKESSNKEFHRKADSKESSDKDDWNRQQDAEKRRKSELKRSVEEAFESDRKRERLEQKMRASWPRVYDIVGHRLSEFPELRVCWEISCGLDLPPVLRQMVKTQNPLNGELSHGVVT